MSRSLIGLCGLLGVFLLSPAYGSTPGPSWQTEREKANSCFQNADRVSSVSLIATRLVRRYPDAAQLADEAIPDEPEAHAVQNRARLELPCRDLMLAAVRNHHPLLLSAYKIRYSQLDLVYEKLIQRRISFGNANRLMKESHLNLRLELSMYDEARSGDERRARAELLDRLVKYTQFVLRPPPDTGRLTCHWVRPTLYCEPY
jgi:hypothetical protein